MSEISKVYEFLQAPRRIEEEIWRRQLRCDALKRALLPSGVSYDQERVQTSTSDRMSEVMAKVADLNLEIKGLQEEKAIAILDISKAVDQLENDKERFVLDAYYIGNLSMDEIAEYLCYSVSHTYYYRRTGVKNLIEIIK